jgi:hypothetical protein
MNPALLTVPLTAPVVAFQMPVQQTVQIVEEGRSLELIVHQDIRQLPQKAQEKLTPLLLTEGSPDTGVDIDVNTQIVQEFSPVLKPELSSARRLIHQGLVSHIVYHRLPLPWGKREIQDPCQ